MDTREELTDSQIVEILFSGRRPQKHSEAVIRSALERSRKWLEQHPDDEIVRKRVAAGEKYVAEHFSRASV